MIRKLIISKKDIEELEKITKTALPLESCALLVGIVTNEYARVDGIKQLRNVANSSVMFMFDSDEFYNAYKIIMEENKELVCIFHSHPTHPKPSKMDLKYMMINQIPWLIMSSIDYSFNAYVYYNSLEKLEVKID